MLGRDRSSAVIPLAAGGQQETPAALLEGLCPQIEALFQAHGLPEPVAEETLRTTLRALACRWGRLSDPGAWLLATLERKCLAASRRSSIGARAS